MCLFQHVATPTIRASTPHALNLNEDEEETINTVDVLTTYVSGLATSATVATIRIEQILSECVLAAIN